VAIEENSLLVVISKTRGTVSSQVMGASVRWEYGGGDEEG
jgi:hypothetical protein